MNKGRISYLCEQYLVDRASAEELQELEAALRDPMMDEEIKSFLTEVYSDFPRTNYANLDPKIADELFNKINTQTTKRTSARLWPRIAGLAASVALVVLGIYFFTASQRSKLIQGSQYVNDVSPGKNTATLTLPDGKTILLSDAKTGVVIDGTQITYNDGSPLSLKGERKGGGDKFMITTPRGGTYQVKLPDGSKVWLNAASSLTYTPPLKELGGVRKVTLIGEAYFEVFHNKKQPFVVKSKKMELTVLGTHFNVNAYPDESAIKTTLLEGSVKVGLLSPYHFREKERILIPNQQAILSGSNQIAIKQVDPSEAIAWKERNFVFKAEPLEDVMQSLARWYDVEVVYATGAPKKEPFSGVVSRLRNISVVLERMESTGSVKFKIEGKRIIVMK